MKENAKIIETVIFISDFKQILQFLTYLSWSLNSWGKYNSVKEQFGALRMKANDNNDA